MKKSRVTNPTCNIHDLRSVLYEQIDLVRTKEIDPKTANSVANVASKIISTVKLELGYLKLIGGKVGKDSVKGLLPIGHQK